MKKIENTHSDNPAILQKIIDKKNSEIIRLQCELEKLRFQLNKQLLHRFGSRSEQIDPEQLNLFDEADLVTEDAGAIEQADEEITIPEHSRRKSGRKPLPESLPREDKRHDLTEEEKMCTCGHELHKIGEDISEQLDIIPAIVKVIRHIRCKYGCRHCENGVKVASLEPQPIPKSIATAGLLAHILVSKYTDHLPLYRQERMFQRMGVDIARATLSHWMIRCANLLSPLVVELKKQILSSDYVQADETTLQVLNEPNRTNTQKSYMWAYRSIDSPKIVFEYHPTRAGKVAELFLQDFQGLLQTDGYAGYNGLRARQGIIGLSCFAHVRRKYTDIIKTTKGIGKAYQAVAFIKKLYRIETLAREQKYRYEERYRLRQEKALPILTKFKQWLEDTSRIVPPKSPIGQAIAYTLSQWPCLIRYVDYGQVEIDTNWLENEIRPFALGRRNWLFAGSVLGAQAGAILYSLQQSCKANNINPYAYFKTVLQQVLHCETDEDYCKLLPHTIDQQLLNNAYL